MRDTGHMAATVTANADIDRTVVMPSRARAAGKTYLSGWVGTGTVPSTTRTQNRGGGQAPPPPKSVVWIREEG